MLTYVQLWVHEKVTQAKKFNILGSNWIHCADEWLVFISQSSNYRLAEVWTKPKKKTLYSEMHIIFIEIIQTPKKTVLIKGGWQWWQFNSDNTKGGEKDISSVYINFNSKALHNNVMDQHNPACKSLWVPIVILNRMVASSMQQLKGYIYILFGFAKFIIMVFWSILSHIRAMIIHVLLSH